MKQKFYTINFFSHPKVGPKISFPSMSTNLERERRKVVPKIPENIRQLAQELSNYVPVQTTYKGYATSADGGTAIIFSTDALLQELAAAKEIFEDGTFTVNFFF